MFILTETDTVTDVNGLQTHFIGLGVCQCERITTLCTNSTCCRRKREHFCMEVHSVLPVLVRKMQCYGVSIYDYGLNKITED